MVELEKIEKGKYGIKFDLGDRRKAGGSLWAKVISNVDREKPGGYAFEGKFIRSGDIVKEKDVVVVVREYGSWKYPGSKMELYKIRGGKAVKTEIGSWNTKADKLRAIITVAKKIKSAKKVVKKSEEKEGYVKTSKPIKATKSVKKVSTKPKVMKRIKVSKSDIIARQQKRTSRARKLDSHKTAKQIVEPDEYYKWLKHPNRFDILSVDTAVQRKKK